MTDDAANRPDDAWEGGRVQRWLRQAEALDRQMAPITEALFAAAALAPGERVVDVGCGAGPIARTAATAVGAGGSVVGVDVSAEMLAAAAAAPVADAAAPIEWVEADVVAWRAEGPPVDAVVSRFGVMFFSDPTAAFTRLAEATAPGGRLAVAVWQPRDRSELFQVPLDAALGALRAAGVEPEVPPTDMGPFSFGREEVIRSVLDGTGWVDVAVAPHDLRLLMGGGAPPAEVARASLELGPARLVTEGVADEVRAAAVDAVAAALDDHVDAEGRVVLGGAIVVVTARRA